MLFFLTYATMCLIAQHVIFNLSNRYIIPGCYTENGTDYESVDLYKTPSI